MGGGEKEQVGLDMMVDGCVNPESECQMQQVISFGKRSASKASSLSVCKCTALAAVRSRARGAQQGIKLCKAVEQ